MIHAHIRNALVRRTVQRRPADVVIGGEDHPYLHRWYVIPRNRWFNIYLHLFLRSDDDRALHDHPWWNVSYLLGGTYVEHTTRADGAPQRDRLKAGAIRFRRATAAHRIELDAGPCWSLFITGPRLREWGFVCPNGWVHWRDFTAAKDGKPGLVGPGCGEG